MQVLIHTQPAFMAFGQGDKSRPIRMNNALPDRATGGRAIE
jgi:hypothetical protein